MKQDLTELIVFVSGFIMATETAIRNDGKVSLSDLTLFKKPLIDLVPAIKGIENIKADLESLTEEDKVAIVDAVKAVADEYKSDIIVSDDYIIGVISFILTAWDLLAPFLIKKNN